MRRRLPGNTGRKPAEPGRKPRWKSVLGGQMKMKGLEKERSEEENNCQTADVFIYLS